MAREGDTLRGYQSARKAALGQAWRTAKEVRQEQRGPSRLRQFHARHWRIIWAVVFAGLPFGSLGDETVYNDNVVLNVVKFVAICLACWAASAGFLLLHLRRRAQPSEY